MTKRFHAATQIQASPDAVWALLTNAAAYPSWNPTVTQVEGQIAPGMKVKVHATINPDRTFPVKVTDFVPGKRMVWTGAMPLGLFKGERTFSLEPAEGGAVRFSMEEIYSGPLASMITKSIPDLQPEFEKFAAALKKRAEQ